jgi:hypothetical protein
VHFLVDFNVGRSVVDDLRQAGYDTAFVGDVDPRMSDCVKIALSSRWTPILANWCTILVILTLGCFSCGCPVRAER